MRGIDYAFAHPSPAATRAAGFAFVGRYVSPQAASDASGKNLLPDECRALLAARLQIILFAEQWAGRMKDGMKAGAEDARHFAAVTNALGLTGIAMYCAADWDATPSEQTPINAYLDGAAQVIGHGRVGIYGSFYVVKRALDAGKATYACQTLAWSGGQWDPRAQLRQYLQISVGGVSVDLETAHAADFGQYPPPHPEPPPPEGAYRHEIAPGETRSLAEYAQQRNTTPAQIAALSREHLSAANTDILDTYLDLNAALETQGHKSAPMPAGLVIYTRRP